MHEGAAGAMWGEVCPAEALTPPCRAGTAEALPHLLLYPLVTSLPALSEFISLPELSIGTLLEYQPPMW